jgi:membrane protein DedA with SNARE-associated domain
VIESLLESLTHWPPLLVYGLIALSCAVENVFPPSPSDVFVVLAAFLSHGGEYQPLTIFAVAWAGGLTGAATVYWISARFADRFIASRVGRLLLPADAMAFLLKEYGRYGWLGLMLTRLLPGFRSVVAPFAGLNRIPFGRFLVPVGLASGLWYAGLTWIGARVGDRWNTVVGILDRLYSALGAAALVVAGLLVIGFVWWRRNRRAGT